MMKEVPPVRSAQPILGSVHSPPPPRIFDVYSSWTIRPPATYFAIKPLSPKCGNLNPPSPSKATEVVSPHFTIVFYKCLGVGGDTTAVALYGDGGFGFPHFGDKGFIAKYVEGGLIVQEE